MTSDCRLRMAALAVLLWLAVGTRGFPVSRPEALPRIQDSPDRSLYVRSFPAVTGQSSNVYEVLMRPYSFEVPTMTAVADLSSDGADGESGGVQGHLVFSQTHPPVGPVVVSGNLTGLSPGQHALHIHRWGDVSSGCDAAGPHFNPYLMHHGGPRDPLRHLGDLGNVRASEDGSAKVFLVDGGLSLSGPHSILGRAVVVRADADDLGRGSSPDSLATGGGGAALACGVVALARPRPPQPPTPPPTPADADAEILSRP